MCKFCSCHSHFVQLYFQRNNKEAIVHTYSVTQVYSQGGFVLGLSTLNQSGFMPKRWSRFLTAPYMFKMHPHMRLMENSTLYTLSSHTNILVHVALLMCVLLIHLKSSIYTPGIGLGIWDYTKKTETMKLKSAVDIPCMPFEAVNTEPPSTTAKYKCFSEPCFLTETMCERVSHLRSRWAIFILARKKVYIDAFT